MKKTFGTLLGILIVISIYLFYMDAQNLKYKRFKAKTTLKVIDFYGNVVENASIGYAFGNQTKKVRDYNGKTDKKGLCTMSGQCDSYLYYSVNKDGYYETRDTYAFGDRYKGRKYERDKYFPWIIKYTPWNPTLTVVLKKIRNPISMKVREVDLNLPSKDKYYPFDVDCGDLVEPYGTGEKAHIYIYYYANMKNMFAGKTIFKLASKDKNTGFKRLHFDGYSKYQTIYLASTDGYTNLLEFVSESTSDKQIIDTKLKKNEYIVFKCQSSTNSTMYNYGKIYPKLSYWTQENKTVKVKFTYYYNPVPDDRNLEFDPQKNLIRTVNRRGKDNSDRFDP